MRANCFSETEVSENVRGLTGYWGPSEGLVLGLRRSQAQTHIRLKNGAYR